MNIFVMPPSGGSPRQLTFGDSSYMYPAWSPDGRSIACVTFVSNVPHVCLIPVGGGPPRIFPETQMSWGFTLYWGSGEKLIYRSPGNVNIVLLDMETGEMTDLISPPDTTSMVGFPRYSPDGKEIAFWWGRGLTGGESRSEVWVFSSDGASRRLLATGDYWPIGWSRDGRQVYVNDFEAGSDTRVSLIDATTGAITRTYVVPIPHFDQSKTAISLDERWLAFVAREETSDIWMVTGFDPQVTAPAAAIR